MPRPDTNGRRLGRSVVEADHTRADHLRHWRCDWAKALGVPAPAVLIGSVLETLAASRGSTSVAPPCVAGIGPAWPGAGGGKLIDLIVPGHW